jgi:hypothetical protein
MTVTVKLSGGINEKHRYNDEDDTAFGYKINTNGSLAILVKAGDEDPYVAREYGPAGYVWVEGPRFRESTDRMEGVEGALESTVEASVII